MNNSKILRRSNFFREKLPKADKKYFEWRYNQKNIHDMYLFSKQKPLFGSFTQTEILKGLELEIPLEFLHVLFWWFHDSS